MPRLRQVSRAEADESVLPYYDRLFGDRDPVAEPGTATGSPGDWWTVYALVPPVFKHAVSHFGMFGMFSDSNVSKLSGRIRELGILRAGYVAGSRFVYSQHCKAARRNGLEEQKIAAITHWAASDAYTADERVLLGYVDALILERGRVADGIFEALKKILSDEEIMEFTYHVVGYASHATIARALKLEFDNVEERLTEIPVPDGGGLASDWAGKAWAD